MMSHIDRHRNWIVPYPIDGLKALLEEGIIHGADAYEKNWCVLQMVFFLSYERASQAQIKAFLDRLQRDMYGNLILRKEDKEEFRNPGKWEGLPLRNDGNKTYILHRLISIPKVYL